MIDIENTKDDQRPALVSKGWAPGDYFCKCFECKSQFLGDKRATRCADCAYAAAEADMGKTDGLGYILYGGGIDELQLKLRMRDDYITKLEALLTKHGILF